MDLRRRETHGRIFAETTPRFNHRFSSLFSFDILSKGQLLWNV